MGWDPEGPVVLPTPLPTMLDRAIDAARDGAHLSLGAVALTVVAFWGEGALAGHGFVLDLGVCLFAMATLLAFLAASAALLATALNYGSLLVWHRIKAKEVKPTPTQTTKP